MGSKKANKRKKDNSARKAIQKDPLKFAERLVEPREGAFRFRVGNYRIKFDVENSKIFVLNIKKMDKAY